MENMEDDEAPKWRLTWISDGSRFESRQPTFGVLSLSYLAMLAMEYSLTVTAEIRPERLDATKLNLKPVSWWLYPQLVVHLLLSSWANHSSFLACLFLEQACPWMIAKIFSGLSIPPSEEAGK